MKVPTMLAKVKMMVEKSSLFNQMNAINEEAMDKAMKTTEKGMINSLKSQIGGLNKLIEESTDLSLIRDAMTKRGSLEGRLEKVMSGQNPDASIGERGIGGLSRGLKSILGFTGKIFGAVSLIAVLFELARPVVNILQSLFKMIGEFVRPIADTMTMLLQPILIMLRPLVQTFRTLMAPFRQLAMQGMVAANMLISQGMQQGGETGNLMVREGMKGALSSASLMLSGFMDVLMTPFKNIEMFGIGDAISSAMENWQSAAISGVMKVSEKADLIRDNIMVLEDIDSAQLGEMFNVIDAGVDKIQERMGGFTIENYEKGLNEVQNMIGDVTGKFTELNQVLSGGDEDAIAVVAEEFFDELTKIDKILPDANTNLNSFAKTIGLMNDSAREGAAMAALPGMASDLDKIGKSNAPSKIKAIMDGISNIGPWLANPDRLQGGLVEGYRRSMETQERDQKNIMDRMVADTKRDMGIIGTDYEEGWTKLLGIMSKYWSNSLIPDGFEKGFVKMLNTSEMNMAPSSGKIVTNFINGFKVINESANNFVSNMRSVASDIKRIADDASRHASRARSAAASAQRSSNSVFMSRSSGL